MIGEQKQLVAQQAAALERWPHASQFPQNQAIDFLRRTIWARPGEVVLLAIGPLTNLGHLFAADPEIPGLLKGLVLMGGAYAGEQEAEWNIRCDPRASAIVFQASVKLHRSIGLNVTQKVIMPAEEVRQRFTAPLLRPVLDFAEIWFASFYPCITFHDPLAAATIFDPSLCSYKQGTVAVDPEGHTTFRPGGAFPPHQVALSVDSERYFAHYFRICG
jgi:inosine-uridine nucleoside N-ribohydrolase